MKKALLAIGLLLIVALGVGYFIYNKPHENMHRKAPDYSMSATELFQEFEADEAAANEKYLDKVVEVRGEVQDISTDEQGITTVTLSTEGMFGIICKLDELTDHSRTDFEVSEQVTFKGICTGMLMDVVLVRCVEV